MAMTPGLPMSIADRRLRAFFAVRGYPDPDTLRTERTIWPASATIRTSRICSASSTGQAVTVIDPEILKAVQTVYSTDLGLPEEWTDPQRTEFITAEADKISSMAASMAETLWEQAITAWSRQPQRADTEPRDQGGAAGSGPQAGRPDGAEQRTLRTDRDRREHTRRRGRHRTRFWTGPRWAGRSAGRTRCIRANPPRTSKP